MLEKAVLRMVKLAPYRCSSCEARFLDFKMSSRKTPATTTPALNH
jgi:hypothetical protein